MKSTRSHGIVPWIASALLLGAAGAASAIDAPKPPAAPRPPAIQLPRAAIEKLEIRKPILKPLPPPPAALKKVLANKQKFDPNRLAKVLRYRGDVPVLQLTKTKIIKLEALRTEPTIPSTARKVAPQLAQKLQKYEPGIKQFSYGRFDLSKIDLGRLFLRSVDHRGWQTDIRDQANRGTCVAHASMALLESIYKRMGAVKNLSENHAYNIFMQREGSNCVSDPGLATWKAAGYLTTGRVCEEAESPYVNDHVPACAVIQAACSSHATHGYVMTSAFFAPAFGGSGTSIATNTNYLQALLGAGFDVVMGVYVAGNDWHDGSSETGVVDVQLDAAGNPAAPYGGHAMLLVGYNARDGYFIFKNSWGHDRGHAGYFYLSYEYLQTYAKYGFVVLGVTAAA